MFRWKATAALAVAAALTLTGCAGDNTGGGDGGGAQLTLGAIAAPTSYDIGAGAEYGNRSPFFQAVFDTILQKNSQGEIEPWLATAWEYNDDNTVLTLTLRDDVTFSDGTTLDADAVVASPSGSATAPAAGGDPGRQDVRCPRRHDGHDHPDGAGPLADQPALHRPRSRRGSVLLRQP